MSAEEALKTGQLDVALQELQKRVRGNPSDAKARVFLFQLLCVLGEWNRALTQLNVAGELDAGTLMMVQTYRELLRCEVLRADVFAGQRLPMILGEPPAWLAPLFQSLSAFAAGRFEQAGVLREQALEAAPTTAGKMDGEPFEWIADADGRLGPCLEVIVGGCYYWVPFARIRDIRLDPPADLRDLVWAPVQLTWSNGGEAVGFVPSRYPGTEKAADSMLRMCRRTEWSEETGGIVFGTGQRILATDNNEFPLLDVRHIDLTPSA